MLGLYEQAIAIDREWLARAPFALPAARRLAWCLLHLGRGEELAAAAERLEAIAPAPGNLAHALAVAARSLPEWGPEDARALVAALPMFTETESRAVLAAFSAPPARTD